MVLSSPLVFLACALAIFHPGLVVGERSTKSYVRSGEEEEQLLSKPCRDGKCRTTQTTIKTHKDSEPCPTFDVKYASIEHYLNPNLFEKHGTIEEIAESLANDNLVVIHDAFLPEFAEALHCDLDRMTKWQQDSGFHEDGFHFSHHVVKEREDFSAMMNSTLAVFEHPDTKKFMSVLSGRNCMGGTREPSASACHHMPGDYSLPHSDHTGQRTLSYQWFLSKNWDPTWGGALYWTPESSQNSYVQPDFNTLALFSVNPQNEHFTTQVSPLAKDKRLSFNGWFHSDWMPSLEDPLEELLATSEDRWQLTKTQVDQLLDLVHGTGKNDVESEERREVLDDLVYNMIDELFPQETESIIEL